MKTIMNIEQLLDYRKVLSKDIEKIENMLLELDIEANKYCNFSKLFTANAFYFIFVILDYLHKVKPLPEFNIRNFTFHEYLDDKNLSYKDKLKNIIRNYRDTTLEGNLFAKNNFLVIQDGYEVRALKKYMKDY